MDRSRRAFVAVVGSAAGLGVVGTAVSGGGSGTSMASVDALVAGSLLELASDVPGASVEAHGSAAVRRLVRSGAREPDAVALADPRLFDGLAERTTLFATNALVVTHAPSSPVADATDWQAALARADDVGRTDPAVDPLGYRTVMALRLAEREYALDRDRILDAASVFPETGLLNAVEGGGVDAAVTYRNMAVQRGLPYFELPATIDFSDPAHADSYARVSYDIGERTLTGQPIRYGATATSDAGREWVRRLVTGTDRLREAGFSVPERYPAEQSVPS